MSGEFTGLVAIIRYENPTTGDVEPALKRVGPATTVKDLIEWREGYVKFGATPIQITKEES